MKLAVQLSASYAVMAGVSVFRCFAVSSVLPVAPLRRFRRRSLRDSPVDTGFIDDADS